MDNQKFGSFLAEKRREKGLTQRELAERIHVTDKAVSKWERGNGFPDIKTLEPLADALDISLLELMRSESASQDELSPAAADEALSETLDLAIFQNKIRNQRLMIGFLVILMLFLLLFLIDAMGWIGFLMVCLPILSLVAGILLLLFRRKMQKKHHTAAVIAGLAVLSYPMTLLILLFFAFGLGALGQS